MDLYILISGRILNLFWKEKGFACVLFKKFKNSYITPFIILTIKHKKSTKNF